MDLNVHNSSLEGAMDLKFAPFCSSCDALSDGILFSTFFGLRKIKPWTIVHGFWPENENFDLGKKMISLEWASQEEQNDPNFSFIAPSSEELWVCKDYNYMPWHLAVCS